jgi:hypothetical protein
MAKKKPARKSPAGGARKTAKTSAGKTTRRRTTKHTESWSAMSTAELEQYLMETPPADILDAFEQSYTTDVVNLLLDLRRSVVRQLFEELARVRKRAILPVVTLYHYRVYLMNPLPLEVGSERTPNYYAILGVPRDADEEDIKLAHRLLAKAHDIADFSPSMRAVGEQRLAEIDDAFRHLHPEARRSESDQLLPNIHYLYPRRDHSWLEATQRILE